jgi:hypothetical protein
MTWILLRTLFSLEEIRIEIPQQVSGYNWIRRGSIGVIHYIQKDCILFSVYCYIIEIIHDNVLASIQILHSLCCFLLEKRVQHSHLFTGNLSFT